MGVRIFPPCFRLACNSHMIDELHCMLSRGLVGEQLREDISDLFFSADIYHVEQFSFKLLFEPIETL